MPTEHIKETDVLKEGTVKLNKAIDQANKAETDSLSAVSTADSAVQTAQTAETKADSVQEQFNQVVIEGDSSVEAAQARVKADGTSHTTLKERLDQSDAELANTQKRLKGEVSIIEYESLKVAVALGFDWSPCFIQAEADLEAGDTIRIPTGTYGLTNYNITKDIVLSAKGKPIIQALDNTKQMLTCISGVEVTIKNKITFDGSLITSTTDNGIRFHQAKKVTICSGFRMQKMPRTALILSKVLDFEISGGCEFEEIGMDIVTTSKWRQVLNSVNQGSAIVLQNCANGSVHHNNFKNIWQMPVFVQATDGYCENITIHHNNINFAFDNGIRFQPDVQVSSGLVEFDKVRNCSAHDNNIKNVSIDAIRLNGINNSATSNQIKDITGIGVKSDGGSFLKISDNNIKRANASIMLRVKDADSIGCQIDGNITEDSQGLAGGIVVTRVELSKKITSLKLVNNTSNGCVGGSGFAIDNTTDLTMTSNTANKNNKHGISIAFSDGVSLNANTTDDNNQSGTSGSVGIALTDVTNANLSMNKARDRQASKTQQWGLRVYGSASGYIYAMNNTFKGNANATGYYVDPASQTGTNNIKDNLVA